MVLFSLMTCAFAGTGLIINHPRNPSHQIDRYSIKCDKQCSLEILESKSLKGSSKLVAFEPQISEIFDLVSNGQFPMSNKTPLHKVLYKIEANHKGKEVEVILGYPKSYQGTEFQKYSALVSRIEEIKKTMREEIKENE
jgi:hypothetical protein